MKSIRFTIPIFISLIICSCKPTQLVTQVDLTRYEKEFRPGLTQDDINAITQRKNEEFEKNSLGHKLPNITIKRLDGTELGLKGIINKTTVLGLTGAHCSWGMTGLSEDLRKAEKRLIADKIDFEIICLLVKDSSDYKDTKKFNEDFNVLKTIFPKTFIIDRTESNKLNFYANPTRYIINKNKIIEHIGIGVSTADGLYKELNKDLTEINK